MNDLLKEFCEVAPEEWRARRFDEPISHAEVKAGDIGIMVEGAALLIRLADDRASSEAIIFLLDWLEERGKEGSLEPLYAMGGGAITRICGYRYLGRKNVMGNGKTRIEALIRAVVAVRKEAK